MGGINGIVKYTVVDSPGVPPLTPVSLLRQVGAVIDLNNNTMELKKIGTTTALRILSTGHVAHKLTEFASGGWEAPTLEQTKLFQARSHVFRPVTLPGEFKQRRRDQTVDFSSGLAYTISNHSHVSPRSNTCACDPCGDDQPTSDCSSGSVLTQKSSICERSFASGFDIDAKSEMGKSHIDCRVPVATTYPAMPRSCYSGSMAINLWQEAPHRIAQTECTHPPELRVCRANHWASMDVCDRKRGGCGAILNYTPTAMACAQRNTKTKEKAKAKDSANINQRAAHIASGALDEKEWDNVCPRCDRELFCVPDYHRKDHSLSRMGPHWNAVYIDQGVSRRGSQFQRQKLSTVQKMEI